MRNVRIGLFGIGLDAYWPQFPGLKERLEGYMGVVEGRLRRPGVDVVNLGLRGPPPLTRKPVVPSNISSPMPRDTTSANPIFFVSSRPWPRPPESDPLEALSQRIAEARREPVPGAEGSMAP